MAKVIWFYTHHLGAGSSVRRAKEGVYIGKIRHTRKHWRKYGAKQMVLVQFDGNKRGSKVPYDEIEFLETV